jgi:hypothetical protein
LNDLLLNQNGHLVTNTQLCHQPQSSGNGKNATIKCLNDVKNHHQIQSIVLNLNSQSSSASTTTSSASGHMSMGNQQQSIMLAINHSQKHQVNNPYNFIAQLLIILTI